MTVIEVFVSGLYPVVAPSCVCSSMPTEPESPPQSFVIENVADPDPEKLKTNSVPCCVTLGGVEIAVMVSGGPSVEKMA